MRYLQTELARAGFAGEVFGLVSRDDPSWTRERWDRAVPELSEAQRAWKRAYDLTRLGDFRTTGDVLPSLGISAAD